MQSFPTQGNEFTILTNYTSTSGKDDQLSICLQEISSGGLSGWVRGSGKDYSAFTTNNLNDGNYHHIAWVADHSSSKLKLYIDGNPVSTQDYDPSVQYNANNQVYFGTCFWENHLMGHFQGCIDDVRIYNRALTAKEVTALFQMN